MNNIFEFQDEISLPDVVVWGTLYPLLVQDSLQRGLFISTKKIKWKSRQSLPMIVH
jgi:hypothetical protein